MSSRGSAVLAVKITGDSAGGSRALGDLDGKAGKVAGSLGKLAGVAGVALGAVAVMGKAAFDSASNLEQQAGAVDAVFGANAAKMHGYAEQAAQTVGLANSEYSQLASVLGSQLSNAGFAGDKLTGTVDGLVTKGADLAAQFGGSTADAVSALSSVLKGETDPIERYGVSIKQSDITARLAAQGQSKLTGAALKNATAQAALALVTEQTANSQGAFARESDTAAGKGAQLSAMWENMKAKLGAGLLPLFVTAASFLQEKVAPALEQLFAAGGPVATIFGQLGTFIGTQLIPALSSLWNEIAPKLIPIFQTLGEFITGFVVPAFGVVWHYLSNYVIPVFKTYLMGAISGIGNALKTVTGKIMEHKDTFMNLYTALQPFLAFIRDKLAPILGGALKIGFEIAGKAIGVVVDIIADLVEKMTWILNKGAAVGNFVGGLFGAPAGATGGAKQLGAPGAGLFGAPAGPSPLFAAARPLLAAGSSPLGGGQGLQLAGDTHVTINVPSGFIGSESQLADAIGRMLDDRARRIGAAPAFGLRMSTT